MIVPNEKLLVKKVLDGDDASFKEIILQNQRLVFGIAAKIIHNEEDRKEIAQEVFIKVYKNLSKFNFDSRLSTWIGRITYTTSIDYLKRRRDPLIADIFRNEMQGEDDTGAMDHILPVADNMDSASIFENKNLKVIIKTELDKLPPILKTIIFLYHQEELSYEEIAETTKLPMGTVKSYLHRGRNLLKQNLLKNFKKEDLL
jgi:RNA polymerase sigma factor (sigma-70 family)